MPRPSDIAAAERVDQVFELVLAGATRREIIHFASTKEWGVSDRTIDNYISKCNARFSEMSETKRTQEFGKALARLNDLYKRNIRVQDYKAALATQKELNALLGLYAPTQIEIKDWRREIEEQGIDASEIFDRLVEYIASSSR